MNSAAAPSPIADGMFIAVEELDVVLLLVAGAVVLEVEVAVAVGLVVVTIEVTDVTGLVVVALLVDEDETLVVVTAEEEEEEELFAEEVLTVEEMLVELPPAESGVTEASTFSLRTGYAKTLKLSA